MNPLVSIITVVFNGKTHIEQSIKSVLAQTYSNIEYIIIDGASTDGTIDIIKKYEANISIFISEKDSGIYNAMNKGLKLAKGDIIAILNADDYYYPETIQLIVDKFAESQPDVVYGNITKLREFSGQEYFKEVQPNIELMEQTMPIFHPATFIKKQVYDEVGVFNETYQLSADYDLIYRIYKADRQFEYINKALTVFRIGGASNVNCNSYKEGFQILLSHNSPYAADMKALITKCKIKNFTRSVVTFFINLLGLKKWNKKRLVRKWR
jgi:glycosyltransferase involved in cell wall biosynthesis